MIRTLVQTFDDLPRHFGWLSGEEMARCSTLKNAKRRGDWLLGRWTAKRLVADVIGTHSLSDIVVLSAPDGAPEVFVGGEREFSLSISHSDGHAFCALAEEGLLGADVEQIVPRLDCFVSDYFTPAEQSLVRNSPQSEVAITAIWSGKEAALKALRLGLSVDTRAVTCMIPRGEPYEWTPFGVEVDLARIKRAVSLRGWWRMQDGFVLTVVSDGQQSPLRSN